MKHEIKSILCSGSEDGESLKRIHIINVFGIDSFSKLREARRFLDELKSEIYTPAYHSAYDCTGQYFTRSLEIVHKSCDYNTLTAILVEFGSIDV